MGVQSQFNSEPHFLLTLSWNNHGDGNWNRYFGIRTAYRLVECNFIFPHLVKKHCQATRIFSAWTIQNQICAVNTALPVHFREQNRSPSVVAAGQKSMQGKVNTTFVSQQPRQTSPCSDLSKGRGDQRKSVAVARFFRMFDPISLCINIYIYVCCQFFSDSFQISHNPLIFACPMSSSTTQWDGLLHLA